MSKAPRVFLFSLEMLRKLMVDLTVTQLAEELVVTGCHYQRFLTEKLQYVREMALRLEKAFLCASAAMRLG